MNRLHANRAVKIGCLLGGAVLLVSLLIPTTQANWKVVLGSFGKIEIGETPTETPTDPLRVTARGFWEMWVLALPDQTAQVYAERRGVEGTVCLAQTGEWKKTSVEIDGRVQGRSGGGAYQDLPGSDFHTSLTFPEAKGRERCADYRVEFTHADGMEYRVLARWNTRETPCRKDGNCSSNREGQAEFVPLSQPGVVYQVTPTPTETATVTLTGTETLTPTLTETLTLTPTGSETPTPTPTGSQTPTPTVTATGETPEPTASLPPSYDETATSAPTFTPTRTSDAGLPATPTTAPTLSATPTSTPTSESTLEETPTATPTATEAAPTATNSPTPTATEEADTPTPPPTPTPTPTPAAVDTDTPEPTGEPPAE